MGGRVGHSLLHTTPCAWHVRCQVLNKVQGRELHAFAGELAGASADK